MPSPVYTFANREVLTSNKLNTNFQVLTQCVAKSGDTLTGTLNVRALVPTTTLLYDLGSSSIQFGNAYIDTLRLNDSDDSHQVAVSIGSNISANRTLSIVTGDANRTLTLSGNPTINDWFDQSVKVAASPTFVAVTLSAGPLVVNGVTIINTSGKVPALTSTYFTSLAFDAANLTGTAAAINGSAITALNASALASGTVPDGRFPATLPAISGANLTALNASNLASGTVPDARFPATLPALNGSNLTNLNATSLSSGSVANARLATVMNGEGTLSAGTSTASKDMLIFASIDAPGTASLSNDTAGRSVSGSGGGVAATSASIYVKKSQQYTLTWNSGTDVTFFYVEFGN